MPKLDTTDEGWIYGDKSGSWDETAWIVPISNEQYGKALIVLMTEKRVETLEADDEAHLRALRDAFMEKLAK